jgi:hypothetical protein
MAQGDNLKGSLVDQYRQLVGKSASKITQSDEE